MNIGELNIKLILDGTQLKTAGGQVVGNLKQVETGAKTATGAITTMSSTGGASLGRLAASLGITIFSVAGLVMAVKQLGTVAVTEFLESDKAATKLSFAWQGSAEALERLNGLADEWMRKTIYDDEDIKIAESWFAIQGRTEEQIKKNVIAAMNLASATGDDLQTAVMKIDMTYEGQIGRLGKIDRRFKDLTLTQLENGAAVDLINEKFSGLSEKMGETKIGAWTSLWNQLKNGLGDLAEIVAAASTGFVEWTKNVGDAIDSTKAYIASILGLKNILADMSRRDFSKSIKISESETRNAISNWTGSYTEGIKQIMATFNLTQDQAETMMKKYVSIAKDQQAETSKQSIEREKSQRQKDKEKTWAEEYEEKMRKLIERESELSEIIKDGNIPEKMRNAAYEEWVKIIQELNPELEKLAERSKINEENLARIREALGRPGEREAVKLPGKGAKEARDPIEKEMEEAKKRTDEMITNFQAMVNLAGMLEGKLGEGGNRFLAYLQQGLQVMIMIAKISGKGGGEVGFGDIMGLISSILPLFFLAGGGPAMHGRPYIVGEKGPEMFIPDSPGTVLPNYMLNMIAAVRHGTNELSRYRGLGGAVSGGLPPHLTVSVDDIKIKGSDLMIVLDRAKKNKAIND